MATVAQLKDELEDVLTLKLVSSAFTEASAAHVQKIKKKFEENSRFYMEISSLYHLVQANSTNIQGKSRVKKASANKRLLRIAMSSNQRFYGNINQNIMKKFQSGIANGEGDLMVIGITGRDYMRSVCPDVKFESVVFGKELPSSDEVKSFLDRTAAYTQILIYYPKFVSLVTQRVDIMDITQVAQAEKSWLDVNINVLFEPDLSQILEFFKKQVKSLLFLRVVMETDLSRTAARLISMSNAEERSNENIKIKKMQLRKLQASIINAKLLETFTAIKVLRPN